MSLPHLLRNQIERIDLALKIIDLPRGQGKTMRLLYKSEWDQIPILCSTKSQKECLLEKSRILNINIPHPICVREFVDQKLQPKKVLVDEACLVLQSFLSQTTIEACTLSSVDIATN